MKKFWFSMLILVAAFGFAQTPPPADVPPYGSLCDNGNQPAGTLLVPYFEVDSSNTMGLDTLIGVSNLSANPTVLHVVVYNVDSHPVFDFNIYLTGYDVVTWSMRQLLVFGNYPNNGCTSPTYKFRTRYIDCNGDGMYFAQAGTFNDTMFSFAGYAMDLACYPPASGSILTDRQCMLSVGSYDGWNSNYVGYVTIDNNITCNGALTNNDRYYTPDYLDTNLDGVRDHGVLYNSNTIWGDLFYYDNAGMQADGYPLVHIEVMGDQNSLYGGWGMQPMDFDWYGINTFYTKYNYWMAPAQWSADLREPLPTRWAFRYIGNAAFDGGTSIDVWRSHNDVWGPYYWGMPGPKCNFGSGLGITNSVLVADADSSGYVTMYGLARPHLIVYDEEENTTQGDGGPSPPPSVAGFDNVYLEAQRVVVSEAEGWPLVDESGWIGIAFDTDKDSYYLNVGWGCTAGAYEYGCTFDQSWLNVRYQALGKYTLGLSGVSYLNGCTLEWDAVAGTFVPTAPVY